MKNIIQIIDSLPDLLPLKPATAEQVEEAQQQLELRFAEEYRAYVAAFGAVMATGVELTGIARSAHRNVVSVTKQEWALNPNVPREMYVVENTHIDGIIIWQDARGAIYQTAYDSAPKQIAGSLADYLLRHTR